MTKALWKNFTYVFERFWKRLTEIARSLGFLYVGADNASLGENCQKQLIFCLIKSAKSKLCTYGMTKNSENEIEINWSWSSWPAVLILQLRRECNRFSEISRTCMDYGLKRFTLTFTKIDIPVSHLIYLICRTRVRTITPSLSNNSCMNYGRSPWKIRYWHCS